MASIDLKNVLLTLRDGGVTTTDLSGAVDHVAGYAAGDDSMTVDLLTSIQDGATFTVAGEVPSVTHTITGHTGLTEITFDPPLQGVVADSAVITMAGTTYNYVEIKIGDGTLTYTEKRNIEYRKDRGILDTVREGDEDPVEVNFDFEWEFLRSDTGEPPTVEEALKNIGNAADWVSSSSDLCEPYAVDVVLTYDPPCSDAKNEVIILQDFRWETMDHNLKDAQVSVKGQCNVVSAIVSRTEVVMDTMFPGMMQQSRVMQRQQKQEAILKRMEAAKAKSQEAKKPQESQKPQEGSRSRSQEGQKPQEAQKPQEVSKPK